MSVRDYFIVILFMFVNLITTSFLGFRSIFLQAEIIVLTILIIVNLAYVMISSRRIALAFFFISLLNMIFLFTLKQDIIFILVAVLDIFILYYLTIIAIPTPVASTQKRASAIEPDEDLFRELGLPTIEQMQSREQSFIYPETHSSDYFVEKKKSMPEPTKTPEIAKEYVHIDELDLPEGKEENPDRDYSYELYYEAPRQTMNFQSIDTFEKKIEKRPPKKKR